MNEYFIESLNILSGHLVDLFNAILNSGNFPSQWSEGYIVPLFKKHDPSDVNNYRGITLVSCFSKIFTGVLNQRLTDWAENNDISSDSQFGFVEGAQPQMQSLFYTPLFRKFYLKKVDYIVPLLILKKLLTACT